MANPLLSIIVPTRSRPESLRRFLDSLAQTASCPGALEVVLVVDADDPDSHTVAHPGLAIRRVIGQPGRTMGLLNTHGYLASTGRYVMLLNDDVIVRTRGWDRVVRRCLAKYPDDIVLIHVNDTLLRHNLCVFPIVSRRYCELAGGICPSQYLRYRIDDHIEDIFNMLHLVGLSRTIYLPEVVFEHLNAMVHPTLVRVYESDPRILAHDAPMFESLFTERKEVVRKILRLIDGDQAREKLLDRMIDPDPFVRRPPFRQVVQRSWRGSMANMAARVKALPNRVRAGYRRSGIRGLLRKFGRFALVTG